MKCLWLLSLLAALSTTYAKRGFILTAPKAYDLGKTETVVLHLYGVKESGSVKIRLANSTGYEPYSEVTVPIQNGQSTSVKLPVPSKLPMYGSRAKLEISGLIGDYGINKSLDVTIRHQRPTVFINTDKPLYKAGQTVNVRVLVTDTDLRPHKEAKIGDIRISDPNRIRIAQWINASFTNGLVHKALPIPEEPVLGRWYIDVKIEEHFYTRTFEIKEYVLPPFEVKITPPTHLPYYSKNATWEVCARYSYGKSVKGELRTRVMQSRYYWQKVPPQTEKTHQLKGCTSVTESLEHLRSSYGFYSYYNLEFYAEVIEEGTGTKINATSTITPTVTPYTLDTVGKAPRYFRPGVPLRMTLAATSPDSKPVPNELIQVCEEVQRKKWNSVNIARDNSKLCRNYTTDENGNIYLTIPPQDPSTVSLSIMVEAAVWEPIAVDGYTGVKPYFIITLLPWFSHSGSHIQFQTVPAMNCSVVGPNIKASIPFHITHNELGVKKMHYQIMSRGDIIGYGDFDINLEPSSDETDDTYLPDISTPMCAESNLQWENDVKNAKYLSKNYLFLNFDEKMTPRTKILLYTVTDDGEIVADSITFETELCFANQVKLRFGEEKQSPGAKATIHLTAEPHSLCSVGVVDKSMYILHKGDLLTESEIGANLISWDTTYYNYPDQKTPDHLYCSSKKTGYPSSSFVDAITAFADNGGIVLSDLPLETRPCQPFSPTGCPSIPPVPYYSDYRPVGQPMLISSVSPDASFDRVAAAGPPGLPGSPAPPPPPSQVVTVRTEFPETWLFKLYDVGEEGSLKMKQKMPDSITEWQGQAVCIQPDKGLGISTPASIVAFQPFFASLTLPYSVVRNEVVPITVTVFNYLKDCLPIKVRLNQTERFELYNGTLTRDVCICGDDSGTMHFHVKPGKLGDMNITVTAETTDDKEVCKNLDVALDVKRSDTITKPLLVEAEGFMVEKVFNSYFCLSDENHGSFKTEHLLKLPETHRYIQDSARAYTSATGDLMGPTLEGIENLVRMPTGCGEQNMVGLVPNIVVLDYLTATKKLKDDVRDKALEHIRQGYTRQQTYRHYDGSYSAFGKRDKEGSIWLTAFTIRTFASARRYISIDEGSLERSRKWVLSRQMENGCFPLVGTVHNKAMKGGVSKEDDTTSTLSAYILIAMLESGEMDEKAVDSAIRCIEAKHNPTNYSTSLFAYATALAKNSSSSEYLERLMSVAADHEGFLYWEDKDRSIAVETASYVILTLLRSESKESFQKVALIARWLAKQRNSYGGFYSTQDTVMALQALGMYGSIITQEQPKVEISVKTPKVDETFHVNPENDLLMQRTNLKLEGESETSVEITASGSGCSLVQTSFRYNLAMPEPSDDFVLIVRTKRKSEEECEDVQIHICASYNHPDGSNMAIIEVKMVTGYSPITDTVKELLKSELLGIKRYEFKEDTKTLYLYISTLTQNVTCFSFDVTQEIKVLDVKPSNAKVYDYYDEGKSVSTPYSIKDACT